MSVIVPPEHYSTWLDPEERLVPLQKPHPADAMEVREAGPAVDSPQNDGPECLDAD